MKMVGEIERIHSIKPHFKWGLITSIFLLSCNPTSEGIDVKNPTDTVKIYNHIDGESATTSALKTTSFEGSWVWDNGRDNFELELKTKGDSLLGSYCGTFYNGDRIDCSTDNEINIHGTYHNDSATVEFYTFYGAKNGKAKILVVDQNHISWEIIQWPNGDCFAPKKATLTPL